jgi:hypothetical protein
MKKHILILYVEARLKMKDHDEPKRPDNKKMDNKLKEEIDKIKECLDTLKQLVDTISDKLDAIEIMVDETKCFARHHTHHINIHDPHDIYVSDPYASDNAYM